MFPAIIVDAVKKVVGNVEVGLETPEFDSHGDYSTNIALILAKKEGKNPQELAKSLVESLKKDARLNEIVSKVEVGGQGFINFFISQDALFTELDKILKEDSYGSSHQGKGKTVLVEYSSPNIARRFGIGHLRSTIIGQALYNLFKTLGHKTISENHLGDWGTQFGTLLYQITKNNLEVNSLSVGRLEELYVEFHKKAEEDPKLWDEARTWFKKLEEGDGEARRLWEVIRKISLEEFEKIYKRLGVSFENMHGESFYEDKMPKVLEEVREKGLVKKSEGAEIIEFENMPPAMLIKSDGTTTYFTRDLATAKFRVETWRPDILIYEVGSDQILHLRQVFATARLMGWSKEMQFVHVAHGLIRFSGGKMSTRKGQSIKLEEVLNESVIRAKEIIEKSETGRGLSEEEKLKVSEAVGIGAVKYFDLMHHPETDIIFDWDKVFVLEGNSGPYLQYTVARTNSVLHKYAKDLSEGRTITISKPNPEEVAVLRALVHFSDVLENAAKSFSPNLLANYLYGLAQKYNNFYNQHRILGVEEEGFRIALTQATGRVLQKGLAILGIETPEKM
jgi:arginyl-tRNA synthetase